MSDNEHKVLVYLLSLPEQYSGGWCCACCAPIMQDTGLDRKTVRRACRSLKRKGLAQFHNALWTEDGEMYGSGYCATDEAISALKGEAG